MKLGKLYIGTSNIVLPGPKTTFPSEFQSLSRLGYYSTLFNSAELNSTFYKAPRQKTLERWVTETQPDFRFTLKLTRKVTHQKALKYQLPAIDDFMILSNAIGNKKGCLLVQFPASITEEYLGPVEEILKRIRRYNVRPKWLVFVEFRHDSWYSEHVYSMLSKLKASIVLHDKRGSRTPLIETSYPAAYIRFHGPRGDYRGSYTQDALTPYAQKIREWIGRRKDVFVYFNNTMGTAFDDALLLRSMCE
ncbi:DUF72 domain-containing protein [Chryseolinea sp. T2]|uniref:DUF72 domain-containing protein n=1 Tax=Chryseolinea sp. T2 TaxID=3129255 RepID=UPI0030776C1C